MRELIRYAGADDRGRGRARVGSRRWRRWARTRRRWMLTDDGRKTRGTTAAARARVRQKISRAFAASSARSVARAGVAKGRRAAAKRFSRLFDAETIRHPGLGLSRCARTRTDLGARASIAVTPPMRSIRFASKVSRTSPSSSLNRSFTFTSSRTRRTTRSPSSTAASV